MPPFHAAPVGAPPGWRLPDAGRRARLRRLLAAVLAVVGVVTTFGAAHAQPTARAVDGWAILLVLVAPAALLLLMPRYPASATLVSVAAIGGFVALGYPWSAALAGPVVVLMDVVRSGPSRRSQALGFGGAALLLGALLAAGAQRPEPPRLATLVLGTGWLLVALTFALRRRERVARYAEEVAAAAARETERREAEARSQAERQATAVAAERLRIARELHDVLAHSLSAISVQAGVGLHLLDRSPDQARSALTHIRATSVDALDEVRAVLGVVRADNRAAGPGDAPLAPTWTVAALPRLVALAGTATLSATLDLDPRARSLPEHLAGVVYRVVQESLTNVRRHAAPATRVAVRVAVVGAGAGRALDVTIDDDGATGAAGGTPGYGLLGMRERVEGVGGTLDAGPTPEGWRVAATFPWGEGP